MLDFTRLDRFRNCIRMGHTIKRSLAAEKSIGNISNWNLIESVPDQLNNSVCLLDVCILCTVYGVFYAAERLAVQKRRYR